MSVWNDMRKRSLGKAIKEEDNIEREEKNLWQDISSQTIVFKGHMDKYNFPSHPQCGDVYFVKEQMTIDGEVCQAGSMLLYDGHAWRNAGLFEHQRVDANIGYYKPIF